MQHTTLAKGGESVLVAQPDLFTAPGPPGLSLAEDIVTSAEEMTLIAAIDKVALSPFRFQGWVGKRLGNGHGMIR